jgi:hypothetical protein
MIAEQGRLAWQVSTGYGQRSLTETTMGRNKTLTGPRLRACGCATQQTEAAIGAAVLNRVLVAGGPASVGRQPVTAQQLGVGAISPSVCKCTSAMLNHTRPNAMLRPDG